MAPLFCVWRCRNAPPGAAGARGAAGGAGVSVLGRGGQGATPSLPEAPRGGDVERGALNSAPGSGSGPGQGSELPRAGWI